jgi:cytochrome c553
MRRAAVVILCGAAAAMLAVSGLGGPSSPVAWTVETLKTVRGGDAAKGKKLHEDCAQCHGDAGNTDIPDVPDLGGQDPLYLYKQILDYKAGSRASSIMNEAVKALSEKDAADLAAFYASQKPFRATTPQQASSAAAIRLATVGDGVRLIPACDSCHFDRGSKNPGFYALPVLQDQKFQDITVQITAFRSGERANDVYRVMRSISKALTDDEIAALAAYYSGTLAKPEPPPKKP